MSVTRIEKIAIVITAIMIAASIAWMQMNVTLSVAGGAVISLGSFALLCLFVGKAAKATGGARAAFLIGIFLKLVVVCIVLWLAVEMFPTNPFAFMAGLSVTALSIVVELFFARRKVSQ